MFKNAGFDLLNVLSADEQLFHLCVHLVEVVTHLCCLRFFFGFRQTQSLDVADALGDSGFQVLLAVNLGLRFGLDLSANRIITSYFVKTLF
jgi:hypothetical protein